MTFDFGAKGPEGASEREAVTDEKVLALAEAGADWFCTFCKAGNRGTGERCASCNAPRAAPEAPAEAAPAPASPEAPPPQPPPQPPPPQPQPPPQPRAANTPVPGAVAKAVAKGCGALVVLLLMVLGLGVVGYRYTRPVEVAGEVSAREWSRSIHVERLAPEGRRAWKEDIVGARYALPTNGEGGSEGRGDILRCEPRRCAWKGEPGELLGTVAGVHWKRAYQRERRVLVPGEGWRSDAPSDALIRSCSSRERHPARCETKTRKKECGSERQCAVKDLGNGFAEEVCTETPRYCDEPYEQCHEAVKADWCTHEVPEWRQVDRRERTGTVEPARWPEPFPPHPDERVSPSEEYRVELAYAESGEDKRHELKLPSAEELARWTPGHAVALKPGRLWGINGARPLGDLSPLPGEAPEECGEHARGKAGRVYRESCEYEHWRWMTLEHTEVRGAGAGEPGPWPEPKQPLAAQDRLVKSEQLSVTLATTYEGERKEMQLRPWDAHEYARWPLGRPARLRVRFSGAVELSGNGDAPAPERGPVGASVP